MRGPTVANNGSVPDSFQIVLTFDKSDAESVWRALSDAVAVIRDMRAFSGPPTYSSVSDDAGRSFHRASIEELREAIVAHGLEPRAVNMSLYPPDWESSSWWGVHGWWFARYNSLHAEITVLARDRLTVERTAREFAERMAGKGHDSKASEVKITSSDHAPEPKSGAVALRPNPPTAPASKHSRRFWGWLGAAITALAVSIAGGYVLWLFGWN